MTRAITRHSTPLMADRTQNPCSLPLWGQKTKVASTRIDLRFMKFSACGERFKEVAHRA